MNYENLLHHGFIQTLKKLRSGLAQMLPAAQVFHTPSGAMTAAQALASIDAFVALEAAAEAAELNWKQARKKLIDAAPAVHSLAAILRSNLKALHGISAPALTEYGIQPYKKDKLPIEKQAIANAKMQLSRKQLGTLGPKQKKKMLAEAEGVEVTFSAQGMSVKKKGS